MEREIELAVEVLRKGGIILYPTDTVWGIGCDATNAEAVERIYKLKRSEDKHSMLVLCRDADMIVVLKDGVIAEAGNHDTLLAQNGEYAKLYSNQFAGIAT